MLGAASFPVEQAVAVRAGDAVILRVKEKPSYYQIEELKKIWKETCPGVKVCLLHGEIEMLLVKGA